MLNIKYLEIQAPCPKCKYMLYLQFIDIKNEDIIFCHNCKSKVQLKDNNGALHRSIDDIDNIINELKNLNF